MDMIQVHQLSDIINNATGREFTHRDWREWIYRMHEQTMGIAPSNAHIFGLADSMRAAIRQIPRSGARKMATCSDLSEMGAFGKNTHDITLRRRYG